MLSPVEAWRVGPLRTSLRQAQTDSPLYASLRSAFLIIELLIEKKLFLPRQQISFGRKSEP